MQYFYVTTERVTSKWLLVRVVNWIPAAMRPTLLRQMDMGSKVIFILCTNLGACRTLEGGVGGGSGTNKSAQELTRDWLNKCPSPCLARGSNPGSSDLNSDSLKHWATSAVPCSWCPEEDAQSSNCCVSSSSVCHIVLGTHFPHSFQFVTLTSCHSLVTLCGVNFVVHIQPLQIARLLGSFVHTQIG